MERIASPESAHAPPALGVTLTGEGAQAAVFSRYGESIWFCRFDPVTRRETARWRLAGRDGDIHYGFVPGVAAGDLYGLRADGPYDPERGHRFDPAKLLADPYARRIDAPFAWRPELAAPRRAALDTAAFVPRAIVEPPPAEAATLADKRPPGLIYEVGVRTFTRLHPDVPLHLRGTLAGLAHPSAIEHFVRLGASHVELMPVAAWVDERHLPPLGLANVWGYNPVLFGALDPRLGPGGWSELRAAVDALHAAGISVILDVVFNHTGESDADGAVLSLRGLDNAVYYRHSQAMPARLVNDTGCGNTLACERAPVVRLVLDTLRRFVREAGVDGFRFDLAAAIGRTNGGFSADAPVLSAIAQDPLLRDLVLVAEPWDVGPDGYRLGAFPPRWLEWNDRFRDGVRRFWRGDNDAAGDFATRLSGSPDIFDRPGRQPAASVNFLAAHDGFALRDIVSFTERANRANGEDNRDGHGENFSWNSGVEGASTDKAIEAARRRDVCAMLACLFLARGTPLLTAGDEFGRTQQGNNNAYAQDNAITWLDWTAADEALAGYVAGLRTFRARYLESSFGRFLTGRGEQGAPDVEWLNAHASAMQPFDWEGAGLFCQTLTLAKDAPARRAHLVFNRMHTAMAVALPEPASGHVWSLVLDSAAARAGDTAIAPDCVGPLDVAARSVTVFTETPGRA
ncbi:MAG: glycogen debranching protein GlgX [Beijerinckiaceae bacterium]